MFISLNKKILYTISIFLILTFTLFVITFYAVYGSKFVEDQRFASLSALQISELSNNNATLRQELNSIRKQIPQVRISAKAQKILESQVDTQINEISQEYQRLEEFSKNYIKRYSSMKEAVKIIISSLLIIAVLILIFGSLIRRWLLIPINRLSQSFRRRLVLSCSAGNLPIVPRRTQQSVKNLQPDVAKSKPEL